MSTNTPFWTYLDTPDSIFRSESVYFKLLFETDPLALFLGLKEQYFENFKNRGSTPGSTPIMKWGRPPDPRTPDRGRGSTLTPTPATLTPQYRTG